MAAFLLSVVGLAAAVQLPQASVTGIVRDAETGVPIRSATVWLTDLDRSGLTDDEGVYVFHDVRPGPHHVTVRSIGYEARTLHAIVPASGTLELNLALRPSPIRLDAVEIRPLVPVRGLEVDEDGRRAGRWLSIDAVRHHPMLAEPDVLRALGGGDVRLGPELPTGLHVRGGASDHVAYVIEGLPILNPVHGAGLFSALNPDAIARVELFTGTASPLLPAALSGVVSATPRAGGQRTRAQGGVSTTQARVTLDGPVGEGSYLLSLRSNYPGGIKSAREASYLNGEAGDALVRVEVPLLGRLTLLGFDSEDELALAAVANTDGVASVPRHRFEWRSRTAGVSWAGAPAQRLRVRASLWSATTGADVDWQTAPGETRVLRSSREDHGVAVAVERGDEQAMSEAGVRLERVATAYRVSTHGDALLARPGRIHVATAFARHGRTLGHGVSIEAGAALSRAVGALRASPRVRVAWTPAPRWSVSASYVRTHQFAQSLRNAESVLGTLVPVDLFSAASSETPVARSDNRALSVEFRPAANARVGAHAWQRSMSGLALAALHASAPFSTEAVQEGSGRARGIAVEAAVQSARFAALASYGLQAVELRSSGTAYVPGHGAVHQLDVGGTFFPSATFSLRAAVSLVAGRRTTVASGALEWETCNLLDRGCEFAGAPVYGDQPVGAATLPAYASADLGARKHWHLRVAGRDASIALFGTITNVFGRSNVLTYTIDAQTGQRTVVPMRPFAPLVFGLDWTF